MRTRRAWLASVVGGPWALVALFAVGHGCSLQEDGAGRLSEPDAQVEATLGPPAADCSADGSCDAGVVDPCRDGRCLPRLLAAIAGASQLSLADGGVAVLSRTGHAVIFVPISDEGEIASDGGQPIVVAATASNVAGPSADDDFVYWVQANGDVRRAPRGGGDGVTLANSDFVPETTLLEGPYVYWVNTKNATVMRVLKEGVANPQAPQMVAAVDGGDGGLSLVGNHRDLFWVDAPSRTIHRSPIDGGAEHVVATVPGRDTPLSLALGGDGQLYVATRDLGDAGWGVFRVAADSEGATAASIVRHSPGARNLPRIAIDRQYVYYTDNASDTVWRLKLDDADAGAEVLAAGQLAVEGIAADDRAVYWTTSRGLVRLAKPAP